MVKIYMLRYPETELADKQAGILDNIEKIFEGNNQINLKCNADDADAIIFQENFSSYKDFRYINTLRNDPVIGKNIHKVFTINIDDSATGLLKGLYTSLPKNRFNPTIHTAVPYAGYPNELVLNNQIVGESVKYLASWRGNPKSNGLRKKIIDLFVGDTEILVQSSASWFNHGADEKESYVQLIKDSKFSLCPKGIAAVSFRIYESMALGRCPVIIADQFVAPAGPDWESFSIRYPEKKINLLKSFLKSKSNNYIALGNAAQKSWSQFFSPDKVFHYYADKLLTLINLAPSTNLENEYKRMRSYKMYVSNKWTILQRIYNKIYNKLSKQ